MVREEGRIGLNRGPLVLFRPKWFKSRLVFMLRYGLGLCRVYTGRERVTDTGRRGLSGSWGCLQRPLATGHFFTFGSERRGGASSQGGGAFDLGRGKDSA